MARPEQFTQNTRVGKGGQNGPFPSFADGSSVVAIFGHRQTTRLVIDQRTQGSLRQLDESLQKQSVLLTQRQAENLRLSDRVRPAANTQADLERLRQDAADLRTQARAAEEQNRQLLASLHTAQQRGGRLVWQPAGLMDEAKEKTSFSMKLGLALVEFASDHQGQFPTTFDLARAAIPARVGQETNASLDQFEIVYSGTLSAFTNYSRPDVLLLREKQPWRTTGGHWAKVYVFADGHGESLSAVGDDFEAWENKHIILPGGTKK